MEVGKLINQLSKQLGIRASLVHKSVNLGPTQGQVLDYIISESKNKTIYQKDIEKEFNISSGSATELINTLCDKKLLKRVNDDNDKRLKKLVFSPLANELSLVLKKQIVETENTLLKGISDKEKETFIKIANKMLTNLKGDIYE